MKSNDSIRFGFLTAVSLLAPPAIADQQPADIATAWEQYRMEALPQRSLFFDMNAAGTKTPILWGFDTAWNDYGNMLRGIRHSGTDVISCARVSFQPWAEITQKGVLPASLQKNLDARMATVGLIGKRVDIVLNLDGGDPTVKEIYGGWKYEDPSNPWWSPKEYIGNVVDQGPRWADLIDATAAAVEAKGYRVVTASPLNEPDLELNGTPIELFYEIAKNLKDYERYPRFRNIRISGGNTLNDDEAMKWYEYNKEFLDEGNTHQLAGSFDNYAAFFTKVREDGRHATADELHNVMEAIVGVEYGMQTGIWWGSAEQCRGEFMKASAGDRLSYAENRDAWSAGAVYRAPSGKIQGFLGCSERQARPSTYRFVSLHGDVFMDGFGPVREFTVEVPGDPSGTYQSEKQRNAETVINIHNSDDVMPFISGEYALINQADRKAAGTLNGSTDNGAYIVGQTYTGAGNQIWSVEPVPNTVGGDFSYYFIRTKNNKSFDDYNFNIEVNAPVRLYDHNGQTVQRWALEYDGDNWFHIRNGNSGLYLEYETSAANSPLVQKERSDTPAQKWRLIPAGITPEFDAPEAPRSLSAIGNSASVALEWQPVADKNEVTYTVLRAEKGCDSYITIARGLSYAAFLDNSATAGEYSYKIVATDAAGNRSTPSATASATVGADKKMIAHFPLTADTKDITENRFSIKMSQEPIFKDEMLSLRALHYGQLPYSILDGDSFTIMMRATRGNRTEGPALFSTGLSSEDCLNLNLAEGGMMTMTTVKGDKTEVISGPAIKYKETAHITVRVKDGKASLYVNGTSVGEAGSEISVPENRLLTYICRKQDQTSGYFTGNITDLRVFNYALDDAEIAAIASEGAGIDSVVANRTVVSTEYFNTQGIRLAEPSDRGITIVRTRYSDGSTETRKQSGNSAL